MTTVKDLIKHLQTFDPNTPVGFQQFSDLAPLDLADIGIERVIVHSPDRWERLDTHCLDDKSTLFNSSGAVAYREYLSKIPNDKRIEALIFPGN